jgi:hypothetical protein
MTNTIRLELWQWTRHPDKYILTLEGGARPFEDSPSMAREWTHIDVLQAINPLVRPIPKGYNVVVAKSLDQYPYNTYAIRLVADLFNTSERGVYFLANDELIDDIRRTARSIPLNAERGIYKRSQLPEISDLDDI